jgi:type I restriction enzyme, S subunit
MRSELHDGWSPRSVGDLTTNLDRHRVPLSGAQRALRQGPYPYWGANGPIDSIDAYLFEGPRILVAEDGNTVVRANGRGTVHWADGRFWVNNHAHVLSAASDVNLRWLYFALMDVEIRPYVTGSAQPKLSQRNLNAIAVLTPPQKEQARIADVLGALDDKIDSNRRLAALLEETVATLFRARFVDFVGVEEFENSEIGDIPLGWSVKRIGQLAAINDVSLTSRSHPDRIAYLDISSVGTKSIEEVQDLAFDIAPSRARRVVRGGDTIVSTVRPERRSFAFIHSAVPGMTASTGFAVVTPTLGAPTFVHHWVTSDACINHLATAATGSAYPAVNPRALAAWRVPVPPDNGAEFEALARPIEASRHALATESAALRDIRDTLLPKLISGEIRVAA